MTKRMKRGNQAKRFCSLLLAVGCLLANGCNGKINTVVGGTPGVLTAGDTPVPDFEIRVFQQGSTVPIGVGITGSDGNFQLIPPNGDRTSLLPPGDYAFTLEPVGPEFPRMPATYSSAEKTPLRVRRKPEDTLLELRVPAFK